MNPIRNLISAKDPLAPWDTIRPLLNQPPNSLLVELLAWWTLDEASGTRADSHGGNDLTDDAASVAGVSGLQGNAALFDGTADGLTNATVANFGDESFTLACWVKQAAAVNENGILICRDDFTKRRYTLNRNSAVDTYRFCVNGTNCDWNATVKDTAWHLVVGYHDAESNLLGISVDSGAFVTTAHGTGAQGGVVGDPDFYIGNWDRTPTTDSAWDGLIDEVAVWGRVLTQSEVAQLYNSGNGITYSDLT